MSDFRPDLYDPDRYLAGVPHDDFARLRRESPVYWQELPAGQGYWALLKHADVMAASKDWQTFSAALGGIVIEDQAPERLQMMRTQLLSMDPPEHVRMRRIVLDAFTPQKIAGMEGWLRERARETMQRAAEKRDCDFVYDLAAELPLQTINQMMEIPQAEWGRLLELGDQIIGRSDPDLAVDADAPDPTTQLGAYGFQLASERKGQGRGDLISLMLSSEQEDHPLSEVEFAGLFVQIAIAANETTRTLLAGGMLALLENPEAYAALDADRALLPGAIEEMLRWATPVHYFRRTATRATVVRGVEIREGDRVVLLYSSANFDEEVFADPFRFDIRRDPNPHLAFGWGEHFCLGARLARLEARVFFEEFFEAFAAAELRGPVRRLRANITNSYKEIPVRLQPR